MHNLGASSIQFMPVLENKRPIHKQWEQTKKDYDFTNAKAYGLVCGEISGGIEAIDIDLKYDLTGKLFKEYKLAINQIDPTLLSQLVVQKTMSGGYHFIYSCDYIEGNKKLAERETTHEERHETYVRTLQHGLYEGKTEQEAKIIADKASKTDKVRVLLETRGEKGFIACYPTKGYDLVYGDFFNIKKITVEQRNILINVAYSFNEVLKEAPVHKEIQKKDYKGLSPCDDYNQRADVVGLLESHGWSVVGKKGSKVLLKRPGDTKAEHSGNYDIEKNWFSVFSTSTDFQAQTPYLPYAVFCVLSNKSDYTSLPNVLYDLGYGERIEVIRDNKIEIPSSIDMSNDIIDFLVNSEDVDEYLKQWKDGTFEKGLPTGFEDLDKYFLFKEGDLVICNGIDNVGKSTVIWYLAMLSSLKHNWPWIIFSSENKGASVFKKLMEFYWCKMIKDMTDEEYRVAYEYVKENFAIIKCKDSLFNYKEIMDMIKKLLKRKKYKGAMIDPYNSLKIDVPLNSKQSTYEYHYEAASYMQLFGKNNDVSIYLNVHVGTTGARKKDNKGHTLAPQKEDTEMGVMFANKADEFLTIHRYTQKAEEFLFTEIHVRKVKELETGGGITPLDKPFKMMMIAGFTGFLSKDKKENPIHNHHGIIYVPPKLEDEEKRELEEQYQQALLLLEEEKELNNGQLQGDIPF